MKKYIIDVSPVGPIVFTRLYLECYEQPTFFPADDDAGTPARLEIDGNTVLEFEGDARITAL